VQHHKLGPTERERGKKKEKKGLLIIRTGEFQSSPAVRWQVFEEKGEEVEGTVTVVSKLAPPSSKMVSPQWRLKGRRGERKRADAFFIPFLPFSRLS